MKHFFAGATLLIALVFFTSCSNDDDNPATSGNVQFEITDGPADDANLSGVFVTVTAVKVNGETISNFSGKQTIDLMAYQNGNTKILGLGELETGTYSNVSLVLDYAADANGNSPGCYALTKDNVKHSLQATADATGEITLGTGDFEVQEGSTTNVVLDFDLRKAIRYDDTPQSGDKYDFVTAAELRSAIRVVAKDASGKIEGKVSDPLEIAGDKIVVYAYAKGTFNKETELQGQGTSQVQFKKAVTSATVDAQGNYTLAFLEAGDYELHFVAYEDSDSDGELEIKGELQLDLTGNLGLDLNDVAVDASASVTVSVLVTGILP